MAGGTEFKIEFKAVDKELKKAIADMRSAQKEFSKQAIVQRKQDIKLNKERGKDFDKYSKLVKNHFKQQEKAQNKLLADQRKSYKEEIAHQKKVKNEMKRGGSQGGGAGRGNGVFGTGMGQSLNGMRGGDIARSVLRMGAGLAGGLIGMAIGAATTAYQTHLGYGQALGGTIGLDKTGAGVSRGIRGARGARLGFSKTDTAGMVGPMARATGMLGPRELQQGMRSSGMDMSEVANIFQSIRQGGTSFKGGEFKGQSKGGRELKELMASAMYSGLEKGRMPEFMSGVTSLMQKQMTVSAGDVKPGDISKVLAILGKTGLSGFQGARGADVAGKLQNAFLNPGGGEFGKSFMLRSQGFGSGTSFYEAEKGREKGLTTDNLTKLLKQVGGEYGAGPQGALALRELSGLSLSQSEGLLGMGKDAFSKEGMEKLQAAVESAKPLEEQSLDAMKDNGHILKRIADRTDQFIDIGERVAPVIEGIEDAQLELAKYLIEIAGTLKEMWEGIRPALEMFIGTKTKEEVKATYKQLEEGRKHRADTLIGEASNADARAKQAREVAAQGTGRRSAKDAALDGLATTLFPLGGLFGDDKKDKERQLGAQKANRGTSSTEAFATRALIAHRKKNGQSLFGPMTPKEKEMLEQAGLIGRKTIDDSELARQFGKDTKNTLGVSQEDIKGAQADIDAFNKMTPEQRQREMDKAKAEEAANVKNVVNAGRDANREIRVRVEHTGNKPARSKLKDRPLVVDRSD